MCVTPSRETFDVVESWVVGVKGRNAKWPDMMGCGDWWNQRMCFVCSRDCLSIIDMA
jgi:hypothetical protein